jgi:CheY-like chemotaxis protein
MARILLIDDDPIFVFLLKKMIVSAAANTEILHYGDGQQAFVHLQTIAGDIERLPDVIFLDLSMPVMDGWEFLEEFAGIAPLIKKKPDLYIVSSSISPHEIERSRRYPGVADFLIKPVDPEKIALILNGR